jgi:protein phosphatase
LEVVVRQALTRAAGRTDVGLRREENEDFFFTDDALGLYVVADGMGGHLAGNVASRTAVDLINKSFRKCTGLGTSLEELFGHPEPSLSIRGNYILSGIKLANRVIHEMAAQSNQYRGMGTTVAILAFNPRFVIAANVGDSRIYMISNGQIERLSKDHTVVAEQIELGIITHEEAENSPLKHVLTRNLGSSERIDADIFEIEATTNARFVLCTDGVTDLISDDEILHMVEEEDNPEVLCGNLIGKSLKRGGHDNTTVVSVYLSGIKNPQSGPAKKIGRFLTDIVRPLKNVQFCSSSRKTRILTTGIH